MKTSTLNHFLTFNKPLLPLCKRIGKRLLASLWGRLSLGVSTLIQHAISRSVRAVRGLTAGLHALTISVDVNARIYVGLAFVGMVTPLAACVYLLFDKSVRIEGWYHANNFYLFMLLGPYLAGLCLCVGVFLLFPQSAKRAYTLLVPVAYFIGKIIWLYYADSNDEFWSVPEWSYFAIGLLIGFVLLISIDFLAARKFHRADSYDKRLEGIFNVADDLPADKVVSMFKTTWREKKEFSKQY